MDDDAHSAGLNDDAEVGVPVDPVDAEADAFDHVSEPEDESDAGIGEESEEDAQDDAADEPGRKKKRKNTTQRQRYRVSMTEVFINGLTFTAPQGFVARPLSHDEALRRERGRVPTPLDLLEAECAADKLAELVKQHPQNDDLCARLVEFVEDIVFAEPLPPPERHETYVVDVQTAETQAGSLDAFRKIFGFTPAEVHHLAGLLLPQGSMKGDHRRQMSSEEITLVLLARFGGYFSGWDDVSDFFGTSPEVLSSGFVRAVQDLVARFGHLFTVQAGARKFKHRGESYSAAVKEYLRDSWAGDELHEYFAGMRVALDGVRQALARASDSRIQTSTWSRYTKQNDLDYGVYGTMCGLVMAIVGPVPGRFSDKSFVLDSDIVFLKANGLPAVCDGIFSHVEGAHLPIVQERWLDKYGVTKRDNRIASSYRVYIEHIIGSLQRLCPLAFDGRKNKILDTDVKANFIVACILHNAHACLHGSQTSLRFRCRPPKFSDWLFEEELDGGKVVTFSPPEEA